MWARARTHMDFKRIFRGPLIYIVLGAIILIVGFNLLTASGFRQVTTQEGLELLSGKTVETVKIVDDEVPQTNWFTSLLGILIPFLLIGIIFWFLFSSMQGGGNRVMQFGKSRAKLASKESPKVTFADVAGADEAVEELEEIKDFLKDPAKFQAVGARIPKGVLLYGPPGTGKTLLA